MKKINFILLAAVLCMLTSCGVGVYYPNAHNVFGAQTTVHLDKANFRVVRNVEAVVAVTNTNLSRSSVEKSAYGQLLRNAKLTGSQVLINVVIEEVQRASGGLLRWFIGAPKIVQYVAARATIIEFLDENGNPTISQPYHPINTIKQATNNATDIVKTDTIKTQSKQPKVIDKNEQQVLTMHKEIIQLMNDLPGNSTSKSTVMDVYIKIYQSSKKEQEELLQLQQIQYVVLTYLEKKTRIYPNLENQLINASSMEDEIAIFLSYYKE
jgi:hypothetical protein